MRASLICATLCAVFIASSAFAQTDVGVSASVLAAIQPVDDAYVGSPYLSEGIGGLGPGFGAGMSIITRDRLVITGRYTFNERETRQQYLGIGPHVIRAGAGIRIRLN
jgi:hypothetical protein